ncbi:MAG TPA: SRPBCC family protein [Hyphomonadaceae bacterium]|nr:SRPBCC family protein [Hyphomonadaceae bacterium]
MIVRLVSTAALLAALSGCVVVHEEKVERVRTPVAAAEPVGPPPIPVLAQSPPPAPAPAPTGPAPLQVPNPTYVTIPMEIVVAKPVKEVWARIGKYCDIAEWLQIASGCTITSGRDGEIGAVRTVGSEILVARTEYSYTYTQPVREGRPYNLYHGTLEARPIDARSTRLIYTLMYDNSLITGDKQADIDRRRTAFMRALTNMKTLAEGGTLPPPAAPRQ